MPLRILKRHCKQYNVVSKSTFVISVELLDNGVMECTLDAESTGRDCLLNVSQRLGLHQPEFFGLRYISRGVPPRQRWVELDRPLRKQLEKNAQDSQLSLGVMFYVNDVNLLKDEMARYHYFLQLKNDVIDGKLNLSIEQAISLAAYSLQAEFGDFDPERHTVEYLRNFAILPKDLISEQKYPQINVDGLYEAVVRQYASLIGFPPPLAEIYYIMVAQQLDGYGQEPYPAKDDAGNDILICVSANGLIIRRRDWTHIAAFRWIDIKSLLGHKRLFVVESSQSHRTMQYHFTDAEVAKYVRKMCLLQSTFHKDNIHSANSIENQQQPLHTSTYSSRSTNLNMSATSSASGGAQIPATMMNMDQIDGTGSYFSGVTPDLLAPTLQSTSHSSLMSSNNASSSFNQSGLSLNSSSGFPYPQPLPHLHPHQMQIFPPQQHQLQQHPQIEHQQLLFHHPGELYNQMQMMPNVRTNPLALENDQELYSNGYGRAVSDYTAALQQKYGNMIPLSIPRTSSELYFSGQRDQNQDQQKSSLEEEPIYQNEIVSQMHSMELRDSASSSAADINGNASTATSSSNVNGNSTVTSTPSSNSNNTAPTTMSQLQNGNTLSQQSSHSNLEDTHPLYVFKPPPPYPGLGTTGMKNGSSNASLQNKTSNPLTNSNQTMSASSSNTNSNSSLSTSKELTSTQLIIGKNGQIILPSSLMSKLSPSAISAIVSAQVHSEPQGESRNSENKLIQHQQQNKEQKTLTIEHAQNSVELENNAYEFVEFGCEKRNESQTNDVFETTTADNKSILTANTSSTLDANSSFVTTTTTAIREAPAVNPTTSSCFPDKLQLTEEVESRPKNKAGQLFGKPIDPAVLREFQAISKTKPNPNFTTALKRENSKRNRTPDILPYEDNVIRLSPSRQNPTGYINASPLSISIGDKEWLYNVAQLPLAGNGPALWQMIWESEIKVIVSLERDSSAPFYPLQKGVALTFNDFQVVEGKGERRNSSSPTIAREFTLIYVPKKKQRKVWVLPYEEEWRDDVPIHTEHFLCFLEEVNSIQRKVSEPSSALTVICGTGAGRSGIFILSDLLLHAADCGHKLRCDSLLNELRTQRMSLVTTASQYAFVLHTLAKYLAQSRLI